MSLTVGDLRFTSGTDVHRLAVNLDFQTSGRTKVECVNAGFTILKCFQFVSMLYYQKDVNCQTLFALYSTNIFWSHEMEFIYDKVNFWGSGSNILGCQNDQTPKWDTWASGWEWNPWLCKSCALPCRVSHEGHWWDFSHEFCIYNGGNIIYPLLHRHYCQYAIYYIQRISCIYTQSHEVEFICDEGNFPLLDRCVPCRFACYDDCHEDQCKRHPRTTNFNQNISTQITRISRIQQLIQSL